jgi:hypothetical protein
MRGEVQFEIRRERLTTSAVSGRHYGNRGGCIKPF